MLAYAARERPAGRERVVRVNEVLLSSRLQRDALKIDKIDPFRTGCRV